MAKTAICTIVIDGKTNIEFAGLADIRGVIGTSQCTNKFDVIHEYLYNGFEIDSISQTPFHDHHETTAKILLTVIFKKP